MTLGSRLEGELSYCTYFRYFYPDMPRKIKSGRETLTLLIYLIWCTLIRKTILRYFKGHNHCKNRKFPLTWVFWQIFKKWPFNDLSMAFLWPPNDIKMTGIWVPFWKLKWSTHWYMYMTLNGGWWSTGQKTYVCHKAQVIGHWIIWFLHVREDQNIGLGPIKWA